MKIMVLTSRFPYPIEKGDKLRIFHQIRELSRNHELILCALSTEKISPKDHAQLAALCSSVHIFPIQKSISIWRVLGSFGTPTPMQSAYFFRPDIKKRIKALIQAYQPDHIYCQLIRMAAYVEGVAPHISKTIDYMDAFSVGMRRREAHSPFLLKGIWRSEALKLEKYEGKCFSWFTHHSIISDQDRSLLQVPHPEKIHIVPNGVDTEFFSPMPEREKAYEIAFVGNMGYYPNVQAAKRLVKKIMPLVWQQKPKARVLIAGARPDKQLLLLGQDPRVHISGWMDDIRHAYADSRLFVAPLDTGSGQQNKILEAMSMALPCITTPLVNNAIGAPNNVALMLADSDRSFASVAIELLDNGCRSEQLSANALNWIQANFSWKGAVARLENIWKV